MTSRQKTRKRWALTLPLIFVSMGMAFSVITSRIMPMTATQTSSSRMASQSSSYADSLQKPKALKSSPPSGGGDGDSSHSFLQRTSGQGWQMWDRSSVLFEDLGLTCNWNQYRPFAPQGREAKESVPFCAHPLSDDKFISNNIVKRGRHVECDALPKFLSSSLERSKQDRKKHPTIYVDVGANIGTCVMQMLLTTNATIMAFEPHPFNLYAMTNTFMKLKKKYRDRIYLFPIALGAESSDSTIHMASDNRGHAVVSKVIRINRQATFLPPMPIRIERLDTILTETPVHLMKMDAQGFECYIVDGMKRVLENTLTVFFELERNVLNGFEGCSPQVLWDKFLHSGFEMHAGGPGRPASKEAPDKGKTNIIAMK